MILISVGCKEYCDTIIFIYSFLLFAVILASNFFWNLSNGKYISLNRIVNLPISTYVVYFNFTLHA